MNYVVEVHFFEIIVLFLIENQYTYIRNYENSVVNGFQSVEMDMNIWTINDQNMGKKKTSILFIYSIVFIPIIMIIIVMIRIIKMAAWEYIIFVFT